MDFRVRPSASLIPPLAVKVFIAILLAGAGFAMLAGPGIFSSGYLSGVLPVLAWISVEMIMAASRTSARVRIGGVLMLSLLVGLAAVYTAVVRNPALPVWPQVLVFLGIGVVTSGLRTREGDDLCCASCAYPFGDASPCPECGQDLTQKNTLRRGMPRRRPWFAASGGVFIILGVMLLVAPLAMRGVWSMMPTSVLVSMAQRPHADGVLMQEIDVRQIPADQRRELFDALLDLRDKGVDLSPSQAAWLDRAARAQVVTPPQMDRYFSTLVPLSLRVTPPSVPGGASLVELMSSTPESSRASAASVSVWVAGWWIDGDQVADGWEDWDSTARLDDSLLRTMPTSGPTHLPGVAVGPGAFGPQKVRVVVWLAVAASRPTLVLSEDGTPRFGTPPVWTKRQEITVQVSKLP